MNHCLVKNLQSRFEDVNERIELACQSAGRRREDVTLVVVTKRRAPHVVASLVSLGVRDIGENYVQETIDKQAALGEIAENFTWHLIGPLQSRKARFVPAHFQMMHSVDRLKAAEKLNEAFAGRDKRFPVLLQLNVSGEESKSGWFVQDGKLTDGFMAQVEQLFQLGHLKVCGLMTMPPFSSDAENSRQYFIRLREIQDSLNARFKNSFTELSMGTSFDFEVAIQEGATYVRIGEAILGMREKNV